MRIQDSRERDDRSSRPVVHLVIPPGVIYQDLRRAILLVAGLVLLYQLAGPISAILLLFLFAFILAAVLNPIVVYLQRWRVPRMLSAIGLVMLLLLIAAAIVWWAIPPILAEVGSFFGQLDFRRLEAVTLYRELIQRYPWLVDHLPEPGELLRFLTANVTALVGQLGRVGVNLAVGLLSLIVLIVLVVYIVGNPEPLIAGLLAAVPAEQRGRVERVLERVLDQLKQWAFGSFTIGLIVGVATGIGLSLLGVPNVLLFGVLAAIGELIPNLGPILAAIPPVLLALTIDPWLALWTVLFYLVLQQVESHLLTPLVLGEALHVHPVSLVFAILAMGTLFGLLGALLAVPVSVIIKVCWEELYLKPRHPDFRSVEVDATKIVGDDADEEETDHGR